MPSVVMRRPGSDEHAPYYGTYVGCVPETDIITVLENEQELTLALMESVPPDLLDYRYAPGKWTLRQVFGHVLDMEWVFAARAVHFARAIPGDLPGAEQEDVMAVVDFSARPWPEVVDEFRHLRAANTMFFKGLDEAAWDRRGIASGNPFTVRALAFIIAGHQRHHLGVIRERYLAKKD